MGTWGTGPFENDAAMDWGMDLENAEGAEMLMTAFDIIVEENGTDNDDHCQRAVAAAAVVASMVGEPWPTLPDETAAWLRGHDLEASTALRARAITALKLIESASELRDLWDESDEAEAWLGTLHALQARLATSSSGATEAR